MAFKKGQIPWNKGKKLDRNKFPQMGHFRKHSGESKLKMSLAKQNLDSKQMSVRGKMGALKRWEGHVAKPRVIKKGIWTITHDPTLQLEKKRFTNMRYKARKRNAEGSHTYIEWLTLKLKYKNMCLCCKRQEPEITLTEDHVIPLSMGGTDYIDNIQPLCLSCNVQKHIKDTDFRDSLIDIREFSIN